MASLLTPIGLIGTIGTHLLGCTAAKCAELYTRWKKGEQLELRADLYAAQQSPQIASGGINHFHQVQQNDLELKQRWLATPEPNRLHTILKQLILGIVITSSGDIRFGDHPAGQIRIAQITPYIEKSYGASTP